MVGGICTWAATNYHAIHLLDSILFYSTPRRWCFGAALVGADTGQLWALLQQDLETRPKVQDYLAPPKVCCQQLSTP
ncbi:hypothetical protein SEMRO_3064_G343020.1 [Seminavis robusta]|uniref:Uncharacterized protein n=1 Tax=Seminavis robusta TaxID=568900 RepID=A0A9N8F1H3_9STRA|nr:hypothetical protein SEMRO_3064_G343020.1 [Seminavis robusta]|eukprot:Sro3064_g343020.1 n/a (77) ;mRNA; f:595-915